MLEFFIRSPSSDSNPKLSVLFFKVDNGFLLNLFPPDHLRGFLFPAVAFLAGIKMGTAVRAGCVVHVYPSFTSSSTISIFRSKYFFGTLPSG